MTKQNKPIILKIFLCCLALMALNIFIHGYACGNFGDTVYNTSETITPGNGNKTGNTSNASSSTIGVYIAESAAYFLKSHSAMLSLLNKIELSDLQGLDYPGLRLLLQEAIQNMEAAKLYYTLLKSAADITPYNPIMVERLISFDYEGFQNKKGLNATTFGTVRNYLGKGDVTGFFGNLLSRTDIILKKLYELKQTTEMYKFPLLGRLWNLNQEYSEFLMAGQYSAQVFYELKNTTY